MNIDFVHEHIFKLYIKLIFLGKYLCMDHCDFEHDRLVNVQNSIGKVPEANACRKQALERHVGDLHPKCEKKQISKTKRKTQGQKLNDLVAITQATKAMPTFSFTKNDILLMDQLCEYAINHGHNPIRNGTVHLDKRSILKKSCSQFDYFKKNLITMLKNTFDAELKDSLTLTEDENGRKAFGGNTKSLIIPTLEVDHAKISKKNFFSINLTLKKIDLFNDQTNPTNSLPIELKQIPDRNGKTMKCNLTNIRTFLEENFDKKHWPFFSVVGDAALISMGIVQEFKNEPNLEHLYYCANICTNHLDPLLYKHTIFRLLDDCNIECNKKLYPGRKKKNKGLKLFFWGSENKEFVMNFELFNEYLDICTEIDPTSNLKFDDQLIAIQKKFILNECEKIGELENEPVLKNPYSCDVVSQYESQFFKHEYKPRQRIHRVPPASDMKQRRLTHQWEEMLGCADYAHMLIDENEQFTTRIKNKLKIKELKVLDVGMKHKLGKFVGMLKLVKSVADSRNENENFNLLRAINLSVKIACEDLFENEFTW